MNSLQKKPGKLDLFGRLAVLAIAVACPFAIQQGHYRYADLSQWAFVQVAAAIVGAIWVTFGLMRGVRKPSLGSVLVILFAAWALASVLWSAQWRFVLNELCALAAGVVIYAMVMSNRTRGERLIPILLWAVIAVGAFNALIGELQFLFTKGPLGETSLSALLSKGLGYSNATQPGKLNIRALFGHPNYLAGYLVPTTFLAFHMALNPKGHRHVGVLVLTLAVSMSFIIWNSQSHWRIHAIAALLVGVLIFVLIIRKWAWAQGTLVWLLAFGLAVGVVICRSRSGWAAAGMTSLGAVLTIWHHRRLSWPLLVGYVLCVVVGISGILYLHQRNEARRSPEEITSLSTLTPRIFSYGIAAEMFAERPVLGLGYGTFKVEYFPAVIRFQKTSDESALYESHLREVGGRPPYHVHNDYFEVAVELGIIGLILFVGILAWTAVRLGQIALAPPATRRTWSALALGCALLAMSCDMVMSYPFNLPLSAVLFWVLLGCAHRLVEDDKATL